MNYEWIKEEIKHIATCAAPHIHAGHCRGMISLAMRNSLITSAQYEELSRLSDESERHYWKMLGAAE